jgi:hypothetical protein
MYQNIDFETFVKSVSATTGFTTEQVKTLLAYRDVKYLDETTAADLTAELNKLWDEMIKANPTGFGIKGPQTPLFPLEHISKVAGSFTLEELLLMVFIDCPNIKIKGANKFTQMYYGETEAAKLGKFLLLALSDPHFDTMLGQRIASGHRGPTRREIQFAAFLYFRYKGLEHEAFEPGLIQAHSRLINTALARAYECNIIKVDSDMCHYRTAEGERLYNMLKAEDIPLKGDYKDLIDWDALADYRELSMKLNADEQSLFMAVRFPDFIRDPEKVINGKYRSFESQRINAIIDRRKLAVSMYEKQAVSMQMAAKLAGVNLEDFRYIQREIHAGEEKRKSRQEGKEVKS